MFIINFLLNNIVKYGVIGGGFLDIVICTAVVTLIYAIVKTEGVSIKKKIHGDKYEKFVAGELKRYFGVEPVRNVLLNTEDGETEVDMVVVNTKGIFAIECKFHSSKYSPRLEGGFNSEVWRVAYGVTMQNPFDQNHKHVKYLEKVEYTNNVYSVVFSSAPYTFYYLGKERKSEKEPFVNFLPNEKRALVYDNSHKLFHKGTKQLAAAVKQMDDVFTEEDVIDITNRIKLCRMTRKERKAFAKRMEAKGL